MRFFVLCVLSVCVWRVHFWFKNKIFMDLNVVMDMDSVMMNICRMCHAHLFTCLLCVSHWNFCAIHLERYTFYTPTKSLFTQ